MLYANYLADTDINSVVQMFLLIIIIVIMEIKSLDNHQSICRPLLFAFRMNAMVWTFQLTQNVM